MQCIYSGLLSAPLDEEVIADKIKGGWVGQMAGVTWGAATEFQWQEAIIPDDRVPVWTSDMINNGFWQDDIYVEIPFLEAMISGGVNCSVSILSDYFRNTEFELWHANLAGRDNLRNGISAPNSGHYRYNQHCDDIDTGRSKRILPARSVRVW